MIVELRNPHSILATLKHRPEAIAELRLPRKLNTSSWESVAELASELKGFKIQQNQDGMARVKAKSPVEVEDLFVGEEEQGVWLGLDCLQDPQNVGAIFRSASFFGVRGIVMTSERSSPMTSTVYDIASGGVESIPFASVPNFKRSIDLAKEGGLWVLGTSEHEGESLTSMDCDRKWFILMGNEEKGIRSLTSQSCDLHCRIPQGPGSEGIGSLNVSVATGVLLYHFLGARAN